jgi:hypothetical protein
VRASGVAATTHYNWLRNDAEYVTRFATSQQLSLCALEDEARERALNGVCRLKFGRTSKPLKNES